MISNATCRSSPGFETRATLFHVKPHWIRAAEFAGITVDEGKIERMEWYATWILGEALPAGGIGPSEPDRIDRRHLADSVLFASQIPAGSHEVWDLGSGIGLPGIPLAILMPQSEFRLIDRSGRRVGLMRRAIRVLDLENCQVWRSRIEDLHGETDVVVSRASLPPEKMGEVVNDHLRPGGIAIVAGSWQQRPEHPGWTTIEIPPDALDQTVWLLIMRRE